ncbi:MAG: exodeoxyribonuclease VII small subunit [Spirochaetota bacterium]
MEKKRKQPDTDEMKFDEALLRLEEIARQLETGEHGLEESITIYEEGVRLSKYCQKKLEEAERKIEMLQSNGKKTEKKALDVDTETGEIKNDDEVQGSLL